MWLESFSSKECIPKNLAYAVLIENKQTINPWVFIYKLPKNAAHIPPSPILWLDVRICDVIISIRVTVFSCAYHQKADRLIILLYVNPPCIFLRYPSNCFLCCKLERKLFMLIRSQLLQIWYE